MAKKPRDILGRITALSIPKPRVLARLAEAHDAIELCAGQLERVCHQGTLLTAALVKLEEAMGKVTESILNDEPKGRKND